MSLLLSVSVALALDTTNVIRTISRGGGDFFLIDLGAAIMWAAWVGLHVFITTISAALLIFSVQASSIPRIHKVLYSILLVSLIELAPPYGSRGLIRSS